ncbi:MAG: hypothetical protein ABIQ43_09135 [Sphingomonas sp.]
MMHYINAIDRFMTAGFDTWNVSLKIAETMAASQTVITARMAMLGNGLEHPGQLPFVEFSRLVPEKAAAFGKANAGAAQALRSGGGSPKATMSDSMVLLDWWETSIRAAAAWWTPVHAQALANARRLT